jgi:trehalose-6-phosphatase
MAGKAAIEENSKTGGGDQSNRGKMFIECKKRGSSRAALIDHASSDLKMVYSSPRTLEVQV